MLISMYRTYSEKTMLSIVKQGFVDEVRTMNGRGQIKSECPDRAKA